MIRSVPSGWIRAAKHLLGVEHESPTSDHASVPFELRDQFLSDDENSLRRLLCNALGDRAIICPKPRVADVLRIANAGEHIENGVRISQKSIDFLICDPLSHRPVCAVQVDRFDERTGKYRDRDAFLERAFASAGLSVLHVRSNRHPSPQMILERIVPLLEQRSVRQSGVIKHAGQQHAPASAKRTTTHRTTRG
jgi:hypothetical protein